MVRQRFDSAVLSSIELERWDTLRSRLKSDADRKRSHEIYKSQMSVLHLACKHKPPLDVVSLLLDANPSAAHARSQPYGELPLHFATGNYMASPDVIQKLVSVNPGAVAVQTTDARLTPLHQACMFHAPYPIIKALVDACPIALNIQDVHGRTPWDIAKVQYLSFNPQHWKVLYLIGSGMGGMQTKAETKIKWFSSIPRYLHIIEKPATSTRTRVSLGD